MMPQSLLIGGTGAGAQRSDPGYGPTGALTLGKTKLMTTRFEKRGPAHRLTWFPNALTGPPARPTSNPPALPSLMGNNGTPNAHVWGVVPVRGPTGNIQKPMPNPENPPFDTRYALSFVTPVPRKFSHA